MNSTSVPDVSVVMGASNAANTLARSLDSVLGQQGVNLEVIVVNDGSKDATGAMLDEYARRDSRVRPIHQENQGLTRALIRGCLEARGEFIARQDADDISLPGRLAAQLERATAPDRPVLVAPGCVWVTPEGDAMFEVIPPADPDKARKRILEDGRALCSHGALLFRRDAYRACGGYRAPFYYAQDIDLILRLAETGPVVTLQDVFYRYVYSPFTISGRSHARQQRFDRLARACQRARATVGAEEACLAEAAREREESLSALRRAANPSAGYYFMGSCLRGRNPARARHYLLLAWRNRPWSLRCLFRFLTTPRAPARGDVPSMHRQERGPK